MECLPSVIPSPVGDKPNRSTAKALHDKYCDGNTHSTTELRGGAPGLWGGGAWCEEGVSGKGREGGFQKRWTKE